MRLLIWAAFLHPHVGGYEKNVLELSRRLVLRGHQVDIVTSSLATAPRDEVIDGVRITRIPSVLLLHGLYPVPLPSAALLHILKRKHYDVVITQTRFFPTSLLGSIGAAVHNTPVIHVERGSRHTSLANPVLNLASQLFDHTAGAWIVSRARTVVGVSDAACTFARHLGGRNVIRIPNGVTPPVEHTAASRSAGPPVVLYVGRLVQAKGVQDLIDALGLLQDKWRCDLVIAGSGPYREQLEKKSREWRYNTRFCGELTGLDLDATYSSARVFVNPSYSEGLPTSVMEAATLGIPTVATDVGGTGEIIKHGETGLLVKPGDIAGLSNAITETLSDPERARQQAEKCQDRTLREYSWDSITGRYCELLQEVCAD